MTKTTAALILAALLVIPSLVFADAGESSFRFLGIGVGSRPAAMAEAMTSASGEITSAFYNPALLNTIPGNNQVAFMHNRYFIDHNQNYLALGTRGSNYAVGGYLILGGVQDFERRTGPTEDPEGTFDENYFIGALTYARNIGMMEIGISAKYAYEKIDYAEASSIMLAAGIYGNLTEEISLGAAVKNIGTEPKFIDDSFPLSQEYRIGAAYKPFMLKQNFELFVDGVFYSDLEPKANFGAEYDFNDYFSLRSGYGIGYDSRSLSLGGGVGYRQFKFDYAFVGFKNDLGNSHRFTLIAGF